MFREIEKEKAILHIVTYMWNGMLLLLHKGESKRNKRMTQQKKRKEKMEMQTDAPRINQTDIHMKPLMLDFCCWAHDSCSKNTIFFPFFSFVVVSYYSLFYFLKSTLFNQHFPFIHPKEIQGCLPVVIFLTASVAFLCIKKPFKEASDDCLNFICHQEVSLTSTEPRHALQIHKRQDFINIKIMTSEQEEKGDDDKTQQIIHFF